MLHEPPFRAGPAERVGDLHAGASARLDELHAGAAVYAPITTDDPYEDLYVGPY